MEYLAILVSLILIAVVVQDYRKQKTLVKEMKLDMIAILEHEYGAPLSQTNLDTIDRYIDKTVDDGSIELKAAAQRVKEQRNGLSSV